jgi:hypothetical protein
MIKLQSVGALFEDSAAVPEDTLKQAVIDDFKLNNLAGIQDGKIQISFNPDEGGDILIKVIDPHAATGYLVFQDEKTYNDWLQAQLYEPSKDEVEGAVSGQRS